MFGLDVMWISVLRDKQKVGLNGIWMLRLGLIGW